MELKGECEGFRIIDAGAAVQNYWYHNYNSVLENESAAFIDSFILNEMLENKFGVADHKPLCDHALGVIRKKNGGYCPITDCKRPLHISINNHMDQIFPSFKYKCSDDVCNLMSPSCYMATVDISSAYRSVAIRPSDWEYQGVSWSINGQQTFLFDTRLSFSLRCAPYIFTAIL